MRKADDLYPPLGRLTADLLDAGSRPRPRASRRAALPCSLRGRRGVWLRQPNDTAEKTPQAIAATLRRFGFDLIVAKVMNGLTWQGQIAGSGSPIVGRASLAAYAAAFSDAGISFVPVVVPRLRDVPGEALAHGSIATYFGTLVTDDEPYEGFGDGGGSFVDYHAQLRGASPGCYLVSQPDPRQFGVDASHLLEFAPSVDGLCPQFYVGWRSVGWTDVAAEQLRFQYLAQATGREMFCTLMGDESLAEPAQFWQAVNGVAHGYHAFAFGFMNAAALSALGALPLATPVDPPITPPQPPQPPQPGGITDSDIVAVERLILAGDLAGAIDLLGTYVPIPDEAGNVLSAGTASSSERRARAGR